MCLPTWKDVKLQIWKWSIKVWINSEENWNIIKAKTIHNKGWRFCWINFFVTVLSLWEWEWVSFYKIAGSSVFFKTSIFNLFHFNEFSRWPIHLIKNLFIHPTWSYEGQSSLLEVTIMYTQFPVQDRIKQKEYKTSLGWAGLKWKN